VTRGAKAHKERREAKAAGEAGPVRPRRKWMRRLFSNTAVGFIGWMLAALAVVAGLYWLLLGLDEPDSPPSRPYTSPPDVFSVAFDRPDLTKQVVFSKDDALKLTWSRLDGDHEMFGRFEVGPYHLVDLANSTQVYLMTPADAESVRCVGVDLVHRESLDGLPSTAGARPVSCNHASAQGYDLISLPLVPPELSPQSDSLLDLVVEISWHEDSITSLGIGREGVSLWYQGRFFPVDQYDKYTTADMAKLKYDTSDVGERTGLPHGVYLQYELPDGDWKFSDVAPEGRSLSRSIRQWVSSADEPTIKVDLAVEDAKTRRKLDLATQLLFLIVGAVIGAKVPNLRSQR
jgi:hypothetical protein